MRDLKFYSEVTETDQCSFRSNRKSEYKQLCREAEAGEFEFEVSLIYKVKTTTLSTFVIYNILSICFLTDFTYTCT